MTFFPLLPSATLFFFSFIFSCFSFTFFSPAGFFSFLSPLALSLLLSVLSFYHYFLFRFLPLRFLCISTFLPNLFLTLSLPLVLPVFSLPFASFSSFSYSSNCPSSSIFLSSQCVHIFSFESSFLFSPLLFPPVSIFLFPREISSQHLESHQRPDSPSKARATAERGPRGCCLLPILVQVSSASVTLS